ncbi:CDP-glucose 4,6-dehydratase [Anaerocolumna jejuensis]|uniref:CDP-glucose 4,6-dehydratase n=1 Tax=Anaerocolumna jejuensis TaxID=259063 RepID=UPI003F7B670B
MNEFYKGKKVFITGHTGFKGTWLSRILLNYGAEITGYALEPPMPLNLFDMSGNSKHMKSIIGDIRDKELLDKEFKKANPEIVIHLAAQPIVRESYKNPCATYEINVMGIVNLLECVRQSESVGSVLNVTTDKVYENCEWPWGYRENDLLGGSDPYSNSKACSEFVTSSYIKSFLNLKDIAVSTARAGNVIGGGDFAVDRIIPDCVRAALASKSIIIRNPLSVRPYQHVLEPLYAYLLILKEQYKDKKFAGYYNVGPDDKDCILTGELVQIFCKKWEEITKNKLIYKIENQDGPHEANYLKLDCSKIKTTLGWKPNWNVEMAVEKTVQWTDDYMNKRNISMIMDEQINEFLNGGSYV